MMEESSRLKAPIPLDFHGHLLAGHIAALGELIPHKMKIDWDLARWCCYSLALHGPGIGSAESVVLRTALRRFVEAIYDDWENVTSLVPAKVVDSAIDEMHHMIEISKEFSVVLWEFDYANSRSAWVSSTKERLPSLASLVEFFELPHMRHRFSAVFNGEFYRDDEREAEKAYRRALAARNKRLNRAAREPSRGKRKV